MTDESLRRSLRLLQVPRPSDAGRERALSRARIAFLNGDRLAADEPAGAVFAKIWIWGAAAAVAVIVALSIPRQEAPRENLAGQAELLRQMEALFPGQIRALITGDNGLKLDLAQQASPPSDQAILVTFKSAAGIVRVLSYSGRRVCVGLPEGQVCFEMLLTDHGNVILAGDDFVWTSSHPVRVDGCGVEAEQLKSRS